ncbi:hypothetical protein IWX90DRAFT_496025 [Phyllosticta citrichinensis]|uniref:Uncharacterized protein n=1 Tax=Phyllosticta citrichinensis TaxID=1130410 RepID=A0ABR1XFH8_9PEZI
MPRAATRRRLLAAVANGDPQAQALLDQYDADEEQRHHDRRARAAAHEAAHAYAATHLLIICHGKILTEYSAAMIPSSAAQTAPPNSFGVPMAATAPAPTAANAFGVLAAPPPAQSFEASSNGDSPLTDALAPAVASLPGHIAATPTAAAPAAADTIPDLVLVTHRILIENSGDGNGNGGGDGDDGDDNDDEEEAGVAGGRARAPAYRPWIRGVGERLRPIARMQYSK